MADENLADQVVDTKVFTQTDAPEDTTDNTAPLVTDAADAKDVPADKTTIKPETQATWPSDWREKAANGDAKKLARLSRYASPQALADALIAAQNKISAGDLKVSLGKDAKPDEIAAYREAHGIPETPDKYDLSGLEVSEYDKDGISKFLNAAHGANMTPDQVRAAIASYSEMTEAARNERLAQDNEAKEKAEDALRAEWGQEFRTNLNLVTNLLDTAPQGLREKLLHGRLSDGTPIGSSPEVLQFLVGLAREKNPSGVVVPSGVATESAVEDEIAKIEKAMRTDRAAYNRDERMQARYRELLVWRENQKGRRAA